MTNGFMVFGLSEAPIDNPIITEWTMIPNSSTCSNHKCSKYKFLGKKMQIMWFIYIVTYYVLLGIGYEDTK